MSIGASAQQSRNVDLQKLSGILRSQHLSMSYGVCHEMFAVKGDASNRYGIMDMNGKLLLPPKYQWVGFLENSQLIFLKTSDSTFDLMNSRLQWVARGLTQDTPLDGYQGALPVVKDGMMGVIDTQGNWLVPPVNVQRWTPYDDFEDFNVWWVAANLGWVLTDKGLYGCRQKKILLDGVDDVQQLCGNLFAVRKGKKYGIVDSLCHWVVEPKYGDIPTCSEGMICVWNNGRSGYLDTLGKEVIPMKFTAAGDFSNGLAEVQKDGKWGYIDKSGSEVIPCRYDGSYEFMRNGIALVWNDEGKRKDYSFIDKEGRTLARFEGGDLAYHTEKTVVWYLDGDRLLVTDTSGKELATYDEITGDVGETFMIAVRQGTKWGVADEYYRPLLPCQYRRTVGTEEGAIVTLDDGSTRYVDRHGNTVFALDGLSFVRKVGENLYQAGLYAEYSDYAEPILPTGLVDREGRTTFSKKQLASAKKAYLNHLSELEDANEEDDE